MFLSTSEHKLDAKNRVAVPSKLRAALGADAEEGIYVFRHFGGQYLEGGGRALMETYKESIEKRPPLDKMRRFMSTAILGGSQLLTFDSTGRVVIPREFLDHIGVPDKASGERKVVFVGHGSRFEIWSPEAFAQHQAESFDFAREVMADPELAAQFGAGE